MKRPIDTVILSGVRLGNPNCQTAALQTYLNHIEAKTIVLNGSFIESVHCDEEAIQIIRTLTEMAEDGTDIYYVAADFNLAFQLHPAFYNRNVHLKSRLSLDLNGKKYLFLNDNFLTPELEDTAKAGAFAQKAIEVAISENCQYIVCGHNCKPKMKAVETSTDKVTYMHPGDWHDYQTTLESNWGCWSLYEYEEEDYQRREDEEDMMGTAVAVDLVMAF